MTEDSFIKRIKVVQVIPETDTASTFVFEPLEGWLPRYQPGQFITLIFNTPFGERRRSYSISSSPLSDRHLSITVKKVDNGEFSRFILLQVKVGAILLTSGISGLFKLPEPVLPEHHFCFLAAGSGIVPCFSMIKSLLSSGSNKITLFYSNKSPEDTIFMSALTVLETEYASRFRIHFLFSNHNDIYRKRLSKWLLEQLMERYLEKDLSKTLFYICGPFEYMQTIEITLGVHTPKENVFKEHFSSLPRLVIPEPPDTSPYDVKIRIHGKQYRIKVQYPESVLASAKRQGITLPYSCEAGRCSSCIATCTHGKLWMAYNEVLVDSEIEKGRVLVCQSYPVGGDAELVYD